MHLPSLLARRPLPAPTLESAWLAPRPLALCNQWLQFDRPTLIVRGPGLSICLETEFGVFFEQPSLRHPGSVWAVDPVSELAFQPEAVDAMALLAEPGVPATFEIAFGPDSPFSLAIQPRGDAASERLVRRIADSFRARSESPATLRDRGAGAWLDQWMPASDGWSTDIAPTARGGLSFTVQGPGLRFSTPFFRPGCDRDGDTCRLSDRDRRAVAYVDLTRHPAGRGRDGAEESERSPVLHHRDSKRNG